MQLRLLKTQKSVPEQQVAGDWKNTGEKASYMLRCIPVFSYIDSVDFLVSRQLEES